MDVQGNDEDGDIVTGPQASAFRFLLPPTVGTEEAASEKNQLLGGDNVSAGREGPRVEQLRAPGAGLVWGSARLVLH